MSQVNLERHHSKGWGVARHIKNLSCNAGDSSHKKLPHRYSIKGPIAHDFINPFLVFGHVIPLTHRHQLIFCGLARLEEEIVEFCRAIKPTDQTIKDRDEIVEKITNAIMNFLPTAKVDTYGSYRTGLYLPTSDIDIVIFYDKFETELLEQVRKYLIRNEICEERHSYIINATVPIIRLNKVYKEIRIDISFNVINGPASALFIQSCLNQLPELQPLIYILKSLLIQWELNESYFGGLSSYSLSLLLINFLRFFPRSTSKTSLGSFLLEFLYHYGCVFNADTLGVSYQHGFFIKPFPSEGLVIIDALDPKNDVSRSSFKYREVQALFKGAYFVLSADISDNSPKILSKIFDRKSSIILKQINLIRKRGLYRNISNHRTDEVTNNRIMKIPIIGENNNTKIRDESYIINMGREASKDLLLNSNEEVSLMKGPVPNQTNISGIKCANNEIIYSSNMITNINNFNIDNDNINNILCNSNIFLTQSEYLNTNSINVTQADNSFQVIRNIQQMDPNFSLLIANYNKPKSCPQALNTGQSQLNIFNTIDQSNVINFNENSNKTDKMKSDLNLPLSKLQYIGQKPKSYMPINVNMNDKISNPVKINDSMIRDINNNLQTDNINNTNCSTILSEENFPKIVSIGFLNKDFNNDFKYNKPANDNSNNNYDDDTFVKDDKGENSGELILDAQLNTIDAIQVNVNNNTFIDAIVCNDSSHSNINNNHNNNNNKNNERDVITINSCKLATIRQPLGEYGQIANQSESLLYSAVVKAKTGRLVESPKKTQSPKKYSEILALPPAINK